MFWCTKIENYEVCTGWFFLLVRPKNDEGKAANNQRFKLIFVENHE